MRPTKIWFSKLLASSCMLVPACGVKEVLDLPAAYQTQSVGNANTASGGSTSPGGVCSWWKPAPKDTWLWDLDNAVVPAPTVNGAGPSNYSAAIYDVDMFRSTPAQIQAYHAAGKKVVCYISAGSFEPGRPDAKSFDPACYCGAGIGINSDGSCASSSPHKMDGWVEWWFDLGGSCQAGVMQALTARVQLAQQKGCDAIEIDNIDAYDNATGWSVTQADEYAFVMALAKAAHENCMGIFFKNGGKMLNNSAYTSSIVSTFDASLNEQCQQHAECNLYAPFIAAGKAAWNAEYTMIECGAPAGMKTLGYDASLAVEYQRLSLVCP